MRNLKHYNSSNPCLFKIKCNNKNSSNSNYNNQILNNPNNNSNNNKLMFNPWDNNNNPILFQIKYNSKPNNNNNQISSLKYFLKCKLYLIYKINNLNKIKNFLAKTFRLCIVLNNNLNSSNDNS